MRQIAQDGIPFTLLPFMPDWTMSPRFAVVWDTEIEQAVRGYETRGQLRSAPRPELTFGVSFSNGTEFGEFTAAMSHGFRVDHANAHIDGANAGAAQFCAPWAGFECWLRSFTTTTLTIDPTPHPWAVGDWLIVFGDTAGHVVAQVSDVAANVLTLDNLSAPLSTLVLADGSCVSPLFFGRLEPPKWDIDSPLHSLVKLKLTGHRYVLPVGVPPACAGEPEWPNPPACTGPTAVASMTLSTMVAVFNGTASTAGTSPADGVTAVPILGYEWDFGDGATAVGATPEHEYLTAGVFHVTLTVRDALTRYDAAVLTVTIDEPEDGGSSGIVGGGL